MAALILMPRRGDHLASSFNPKQPRKLRRYFTDLNFTFTCTTIANAVDKKKHACWHVNVETSEI
jgi:hypothetical protein